MRIVPASGGTKPMSTFISVDLPAPFSPRMPWISPRRSDRCTSSQASTAPKRLVMPSSSAAAGALTDLEVF